MDSIEPVEPIDRTEPVEPIDRIEPVEATERIEPTDNVERMLWLERRPIAAVWCLARPVYRSIWWSPGTRCGRGWRCSPWVRV